MANSEELPQSAVAEDVQQPIPVGTAPKDASVHLSAFWSGNINLSVKYAILFVIIAAALIIIIILMAVIPNDFNLCEGCNDRFEDPKTSHFKAPDTPLLYEGDNPQHKPLPFVPCKTPEIIMPPAYDDDNREEKMKENKIREQFRKMKRDASRQSQKSTNHGDRIQNIIENTSSKHNVKTDTSAPGSDLHELGDIARDQLHRSSSRNRQNTNTGSHRWNAENFHQSSR